MVEIQISYGKLDLMFLFKKKRKVQVSGGRGRGAAGCSLSKAGGKHLLYVTPV